MIIVFAEQAKNDLLNIQAYIRRDSYQNSIQVIKNIFERIELLKKHPEAGRIILKNKNVILRQLLLYKYRIIYRLVDNTIEIITVHHSAMLLDNNPGISQYFDEK